MFKSRTMLLMSLVALVAVAMLILGGCDSKSTQDSTPSSGTQIAVTASPTSLTINGTSVVEATVTTDGSLAANQPMHFTVSPSGAGYFTPEYDTTDATGVSATVFTASSSGTITVTATISGAIATSSVSLSVSENPGTGSGDVNVTVSRSLLQANGRDTSVVTVVVRDGLGQPAPDSTLVKLTAGEKFVDVDGNGYWSEGIDSLIFDANNNGQWDPIGLIASSAWTTGGDGTTTVNYVSGEEAYTVYIKVTVDDNGLLGSVDIPIQLQPNATMGYIYLASDSLSLSVKGTGGVEIGTIYATAFDINGNPMPEGVSIAFIITDGPGGGERLDTLGYGPDTAVTNSQGTASTTLHSGTVSGTVRIRATSGTILSTATQVLIAAGPPAHIVIGAEHCNVPYWDDVAMPNGITAVVSDIYLNPVNDSTVVYFSCDEGTMMSHLERTFDGEGLAHSVWFSGNNVETADGIVIIMAETSGGTVADTGAFFNSHVPDTLIVLGVPVSMMADGTSKATVFVVGLDLNDNPVDGGTPFKAEGNFSAVAGGTLEDGCYGSSDRTKILSTTLDMDYSRDLVNNIDDGIGAIDVLHFWHAGTAYTSFNMQLLTGPAYSGTSAIDGSSSAEPSAEIPFSVTIRDRWGNPLADHSLTMTASGGAIAGANQSTDAYGEAFGFVWTAPAVDGDYTIIITDNDPRGGIVLTFSVSISTE